ncbi:MAG: phosphoribosyltransferase [Bacteroidetes bacterium]|nr:phosphoribosyltransferase [Bacteroidota bacterium]
MAHLLQHLIHLIFPNLCLVCNENLVGGEESVCFSCLSKLPYTDFHLHSANEVEKRFWGKFPVEHATSLYHYKKATAGQYLLHALKYKGEKQVGTLLGRQLGLHLSQSPFYQDIDLIVPVPLHPKKYRKRGYNQSECICDGIADVLQAPVDATNLVRLIENPTQTRKGVYERWENTKGIFGLVDASVFAGKHILLVDDVLTTGSTLEACAQAILEAPNARISVVTLALA